MNTERPDNDDAEARTDAGSTGGTGGASGRDGAADAGQRRDRPAGPEAPAADAPAGEPEGERTEPEPADSAAPVTRAPQDEPEPSEPPAPETRAPQDEPEPSEPPAPETRAPQDEPEPSEPPAPETRAPQDEPETGRPADGLAVAKAEEPGEAPDAAAEEPSAAGTETSGRGPEPGPDETVVGEHRTGGRRSADGSAGGPARRRSPVLIASVAAAVLLVGGGGAYLATGAVGGSGDSGAGTTPGANGDPTPPPLALDGHSEGAGNGIAPGEPDPYGTTYRADGTLPAGPGSAPVYRAGGQVAEERVVALAKALGLDGKPVAEAGGWRIGGQDGSGPTLRVEREAPGSWTYSAYTPRTDNCKGATCKPPSAGDASPVSEAAARKAAAPVLKAAGQDDAKLDASQVMDGSRVVNADPEVGGLPTYGWTTGVIVGPRGEVVGGNGRLAEPVKGDTYPTVSAGQALDMMNAVPGDGPRTGIGGCATSVPLEEDRQQERCDPGAKPAGEILTVDGAVFGLAAHSVEGRPALVPSWLFEVRPEGAREAVTVTHPAVDPEFLAPREQSGEPTPAPTEPGDGPTSAPSARETPVEGYTAEGSELTVVFTGGVCADYEVTATADGGRVTVRVTETPWPDKVCIMIAKRYQETVRLDAPLGDRAVVDTDGKPVPLHKEGARLPAPPTR
ncbi:hypothetical protein GCM10010261_07690 [Streptomyces pilosus]|uniref:hypothetical protein n=1 Tax=Streptomyces pilosus TaxID=28893 RepID=UPI0019AED5F0|nr:hypothetical protein [Streptomyces pilosus]GGV37346.1 hypothetical protein GCM10010261_07690 [Streptomyces pilosus]